MKRTLPSALVVTALAAFGVLGALRASAPQVASNTWLGTGTLTDARAGASATLLADGRMLVAGGLSDTHAIASVERYSVTAGGFISAAPLQQARANHSATLLSDGRVLVIGGVGADGQAMASAEIYDASANAWQPAGPLSYARSGHTATPLPDGRVLVAGGDDSGVPIAALEVFDPAAGGFTLLNAALSVARTGHAAAVVGTKVLIVGGFSGTQTLASTEVFDPDTNSISIGPALSQARAGHSATTLLDGKMLVAGGASDTAELASAELFDPAANAFAPAGGSLAVARQRHLAVLLPHNNTVLFIGGSVGGRAVSAAELYVPWEGGGSFVAAAAPAAARTWAASSALSFAANDTIRTGPADGLLLLAGGSATSDASSAFASAELYGFATIKTDKSDYAPGTTVTITGSGWEPGEWVTLMLMESPALDEHPLIPVQADDTGNIVSTEFVPDQHDIGVQFHLTAFGTNSQAQTVFWDAKSLSVSFSGFGSGSVAIVDTTDGSKNQNCPSPTTCTDSVGNNDVGTLTATAALGSAFAGWSGQTAGITGCAGNACNFSMGNAAQNVTATFNLLATKLVFTTSSQTTAAGVSSGTITVQRQNASSVPQTAGAFVVNLSSTSGTGVFRNSADTTTITTITIADGSSIADFRYRDNTAGTPTVTASFTGLTSAQQVETINAATANKLAVNQQPTNTAAGASITPAVTVQILDQFGNLTNSTANVGLAIANNPSAGVLSGTTTVPAAAGVATFGNLSIDKVGTGYTLAASSTGLTGATSTGFNITAAGANKLAFAQQPTNTQAGVSIAPAVTLQLQDQFGNSVATSGVGVTIAIGTNPGGSTLSGTLTVNTNASGVATFTNLSLNRPGTGYTLTASSGVLTGATSSAFNITAGPANRVAFLQQPTNATAGQSITPAITVQIQDQFGNLTASTANVTIAIGTNPAGGTLSGAATVAAVAGVATFGNLSINKAGVGFTLTASSTGLTGATSAAFNITAGAVSAAVSTVASNPASVLADGSATSSITVTLKDANGNAVSGKAVSLSQGAGSSTISAASGVSDAAGVVTFTVKSTKAETVTYAATDATDSTAITPTAAVTFTPGALHHFAISAIGGPQTAGTAFSITITARDINNNTVTSFTANGNKVNLTSTGTLVGAPITTPAFTNGVLSGQNVTITNTGSFTITATGTGGNMGVTGTSNAFTVNPATASKLAFSAQPTDTQAGSAISPAVTVHVLDQFGNLVTGDASNVSVAISGGGVLTGTLTSAASGGVATFSNLVPTKTGTAFTLSATDGALTGTTSTAFNVSAGAATKLALSGATTDLASGGLRTLTATIQDTFGNTVTTGADSTIAVTFAKTGGTGTVTGLASPAAAAGVASVNVTGALAGSITIAATATATGGPLASGTGNPITFNVIAGPAAKLALSGATTDLASGTGRMLTATIQDAAGNTVATGADAAISVSFAKSSGTGSVSGLGSSAAAGGIATLTVTGNAAGSVTIAASATASTGALAAGTGNPITFNVIAGQATQLAFAQPPTTTTAGQTITPAVTVQILDANNNLTTSTANVTLAISPNPTSAVLGGTLTRSAINGTASFADLSINKGGTYTLGATSTGLAGATSASFTINNPAPTLTSIAPMSGNLSQTLNVVFTGSNFIAGVSSVSLGSNITVNTVTVDTPLQITANVTIGANTAVGARDA